METRLSTDTVKPSDRIAWWRDAICSTFVRLDLECDPRSPFRCELGIQPAPRQRGSGREPDRHAAA
jgi:hypothetical protein